MKGYLIFLLSILSLSCSDFLNEYSQDLAYADDCDDLNEILIGQGYLSHDGDAMTLLYSDIENQAAHYFPYLHVMDDDVVENIFGGGPGLYSVASTAIYKFRNMYIWAKDPFTNIIGEPFEDCDWSRLYKHISTVNVVIERADEFTDDPKELRDKVKGEAYFLRGAYYFLLVNLYANPYVKETANEDLGVPLKTSEMVVDGFFSRSTIAEVYKQIVSDLETSIQLLHDKERTSHFHVNEVSARILLSRVFLYMCDWSQAEQQCNEAIELGCPLRNLNTMDLEAKGINKEYMNQNSCENLFTMGTPTIQTLMRTRDQNYANFA